MALSTGGNEALNAALAPEEDFSILSLPDRLSHKNWKARVNGYEALIKSFSVTASRETDSVFKPYINDPDQLKKFVTDSNAVAQEKGVECALAFVKFAGEYAARTREVVVPALVDKCFGSTRAGTKNKAMDLTAEYVEVCNGGEGVVDDLLPGLSAKQPKVVAGTVTALREIIKLFGVKVVPIKAILKVLPKVFGASDKTVREQGVGMVQEMYRYLGESLTPLLSDLQPAQLKLLAFEELDAQGKGKGSGVPSRFTRQHAREAASRAASSEDAAIVEDEAPNPRTLVDAKDVMSNLPPSLHSPEGLGSKKWLERKTTLDDVLAIFKEAPVIQDTETGQQNALVDALKTVITKDSNIMVIVSAANVLELFARGLGPAFSRHRATITTPLLEKLKERKQNVVDALGAALDAVCSSTSLADMMEDVLAALKSKNPQVKEGTLRFLHRSLQTTRTPPSKPEMKSLTDALVPLLEDSFGPVRISAADCLGTLMKIVGERALNPVMEGMDDLRKAKVKEAFEKAEVKCKAGAAPPPPPMPTAKAPPKAAAKKKAEPVPAATPSGTEDDQLVDETIKPVRKPPARLLAKKPAADDGEKENEAPPSSTDGDMFDEPPKPPPKAPARLAVKKAAPVAAVPQPKKAPVITSALSKPAKGAPQATDTFKYKYMPEDAEGLIVELIPPSISAGYADANWKVRLAAVEEMEAWVQGEAENIESELVFRFLAGKKRDWNEKNFQVSAKVYTVLATLAEKSPSFGKPSAALAIAHLTDKLGDVKLKKPAGDALIVFAEKASLSFVLGQAYEPMGKQKAPKVQADALGWINQALIEFGVAGLGLRTLVDFLKTALQNSNAAVRSAATATLVTLRLFAGTGIKDFLSDLNPQLLTTISNEFDKVEGNPAPEPTRTQADLHISAVGGGSAAAGGGDALDSLYPRVDLDKLVPPKLLADCKSDAWKTRKEALESLQAVLSDAANKRLKGNMGEIGQVLKARIPDTNKAVQALTLDVIARIATAMNKPFEKYARLFVSPVAAVLSDQKAPIRAAALITLTAMADASEGIETFIPGIATALETPNPLQRTNLLNWVTGWCKEHELPSSVDLSSWAAPVIACLDDKSGDVRKAAQAVLPVVVASAGFDFVLGKVSSLKAASQQAVKPMIMAARPASAAPIVRTSSGTAVSRPLSTVAMPSASGPSGSEEVVTAKPAPVKTLNGISGTTGVRSLRLGGAASRPESRAESTEQEKPAVAAPLGFKSKLGLKRPAAPAKPSASQPVPAETAPAATVPFSGMSLDAKRLRLAKDRGRWVFEAGPPSKDVLDALEHQMEQHTSKDLMTQLFSHDHNADRDHLLGLSVIDDCFLATANGEDKYGLAPEDVMAILVANTDLPLKYASIRLQESNPTMTVRCLDVIAHVLALLDKADYSLTDAEVATFVPTMINKFSDSRDLTRDRIRGIFQVLEKQYPYSKIFQLLMEHGLKSKAARARQSALDELAGLLSKHGVRACDPPKTFPVIASMISDRDQNVRQSALAVIGEGYSLVGDAIWTYVGSLSEKDKTLLEERLRRLPLPSKPEQPHMTSGISRMTSGLRRPASPSKPNGSARTGSPGPSKLAYPHATSPVRSVAVAASDSAVPLASRLPSSGLPMPGARQKSILPSRLAAPRSRPPSAAAAALPVKDGRDPIGPSTLPRPSGDIGAGLTDFAPRHGGPPSADIQVSDARRSPPTREVSVSISQILSNDPERSVKALKEIQEILEVAPRAARGSDQFKELAEHTEGLIETITLEMAHVFDRPNPSLDPAYYRLAKHLVHTLTAFFDHSILAESLTVDTLTSLLEELTLRLIQTDEDDDDKGKELSRYINMLLLKIFGAARRIAVFRAFFALLLRLTRPMSATETPIDSREVKVTDLVLKCVWKLARNIPGDLEKELLDPCELLPCIEAFLQSIPPNEWRARSANKVPSGDMPLRTVKVIIQHLVTHYGEQVYEQLSASFDDPSATIVYPYVYRIINAPAKRSPSEARAVPSLHDKDELPPSSAGVHPSSPRVAAPAEGYFPSSSSASSIRSSSETTTPSRHESSASLHERTSTPTRPASASANGHVHQPAPSDDDPDGRLIEILDHISSETTGSLHKQGITELYHFLKVYPHKKPKVDKMLDATGPQFRKYITRALASRAEDDEERDLAVADTLSRLEASRRPSAPTSPAVRSAAFTPALGSPRRASGVKDLSPEEEKHLTRLHDIFRYQGRSSVLGGSPNRQSTGSSTPTPPSSESRPATSDVLAQLASLRER